mgnify:CR=1 FL=1
MRGLGLNDLTYWSPTLNATGVPVPKTEIISTDVKLQRLLDGHGSRSIHGLGKFLKRLDSAARRVGPYPIFLRTGHGSGKHYWSKTCYVPHQEALLDHVREIVEWSELCSWIGLPTDVWAVREFLDLEAPFTAFHGMPVAMERRLFVNDGHVLCDHPYWPSEVLEEANPTDPNWEGHLEIQERIWTAERSAVWTLAERVSGVFAGCWSVDFARQRAGGWVAIDMALGEDSWHWPGCQAPVPQREWRETNAL